MAATKTPLLNCVHELNTVTVLSVMHYFLAGSRHLITFFVRLSRSQSHRPTDWSVTPIHPVTGLTQWQIIHTLIQASSQYLESLINLWNMWVVALAGERNPRENPCRHWENMKTPNSSLAVDSNPRPSYCEAIVLPTTPLYGPISRITVLKVHILFNMSGSHVERGSHFLQIG